LRPAATLPLGPKTTSARKGSRSRHGSTAPGFCRPSSPTPCWGPCWCWPGWMPRRSTGPLRPARPGSGAGRGNVSGIKARRAGRSNTSRRIRVDCDQDAVWLTVRMPGRLGCCHTGRPSCFYRRVVDGPGGPALAHDAVRGDAGSQGAWGPSETRRRGPKSALVSV